MGNANAARQMSNYSKRSLRVFVTETALQIDALITSQSGRDDRSSSLLPGDRQFSFRTDTKCVRVLTHHLLSVFVEDEGDENICSKHIVHDVVLSAPSTVLLCDV